MTDKEYEKALKEREEVWINEEFKPRKLTEEEIEQLKRKDVYRILLVIKIGDIFILILI